MNTEQKIKIAKILSRIICLLRSCVGLGSRTITIRNGVRWDLDLTEGFDLSIYLTGSIEKDTSSALRKNLHKGDFVLDIGSNLGGHLLPISKEIGPDGMVYSFEASEHAYQRQLKNIQLNPKLSKNIKSYHAFLVEHKKEKKPAGIHSSWPLMPDKKAKLHPVHKGKMHAVGKADVFSLDEWCEKEKPKKIDLIKLDVDGFEVPVLRGAKKLLKKYTPKILIELAPYIHKEQGYSFEQLIKMLNEYGYMAKKMDGENLALDKKLRKKIPLKGSLNVILNTSSSSRQGALSEKKTQQHRKN